MKNIEGMKSKLYDSDPHIRCNSLRHINENIELNWSSLVTQIQTLQKLTNNEQTKYLAHAILSQIYYNLGQHQDQAVQHALLSGQQYQKASGIWKCSIVNRCIQKYVTNRKEMPVNQRQLVQKLLKSSLQNRQIKLVLGIALDSQNIDLIKVLLQKITPSALYNEVSLNLPYLKQQFLKQLLAQFIPHLESFSLSNTLNILKYLDNYEMIAKLLYDFVKNGKKQQGYAIALQVGEMCDKVAGMLPIQQGFQQQRKKLVKIINGQHSYQLNSFFLKNNAHTDPYYLNLLKKIQSKVSVTHTAAVLSVSLLQTCTQDDSFIKVKQNMEWVGQTSNWARFSTTASLGLIWRGNKKQARNVFKKYLPEQMTGSPNYFVNGGALYGLGIVFQGSKQQELFQYILQLTQNPTYNNQQPLIHGACLSLGLIGFGSGNQAVYQKLKDILNTNSAVTGEAAALAIGLLWAGSNNDEAIAELINFGTQTQHQKISRSVCLALSFISTNTQILSQLPASLQLSNSFILAITKFGTSDPQAIKKLLQLSCHLNPDIKRTAIISLGFVMHGDNQLLNIMQMMVNSFDPQIRYGVGLALAIGAKHQSTDQFAQMIWPLLTDNAQFVRQSAFISIAILMQSGSLNSSKTQEFTKLTEQIIGKKHQDVLSKMGAILAVGIMDIGGRNMSINLKGSYGPRLLSLVSLLTFTNFWHWYPYINMIGLSLKANVLIGIDQTLDIPQEFQFKCKAKKSNFDYRPFIIVFLFYQKQEKKEQGKKEKVQLSITNKAKVRAQKHKGEMQLQKIQQKIEQQKVGQSNVQQKESKEQVKQGKQKEQVRQFKLNNVSRVLDKQKRYIEFYEDNRFYPVNIDKKQGITMVKNKFEGQVNYLNVKKTPVPPVQKSKQKQDEVQMPNQFIYDQ